MQHDIFVHLYARYNIYMHVWRGRRRRRRQRQVAEEWHHNGVTTGNLRATRVKLDNVIRWFFMQDT